MLRPIGDKILVTPILKDTQSPGGLELVYDDAVKLNEGLVIAAGPGLVDDTGKLVALQVKVGDQIAFGKFAGQKVVLKNKKYLILHEHEVLGIEQPETSTEEIMELMK